MDERNASAKDILRIDPIGSDNLSALMHLSGCITMISLDIGALIFIKKLIN